MVSDCRQQYSPAIRAGRVPAHLLSCSWLPAGSRWPSRGLSFSMPFSGRASPAPTAGLSVNRSTDEQRATAGRSVQECLSSRYSVQMIQHYNNVLGHGTAPFCDALPAILEFLPEGSGPLGVEPTCILRPRAFDPARCLMMHDRRARSTTKSGFPVAFSAPLFDLLLTVQIL
jgi:hypothetical protein